MKPKVAVIGSLNMDIVVKVNKLPGEGETLLGSGMSEIPGGKGANQAVAVAKLGTPVAMIGKVGPDAFGAALGDSLRQAGVDAGPVDTGTRPTGIAVITVDAAGRNHIVVVPGANAELTPDDIDRRLDVIEQCDVVVLQLEVPIATVEYALRLAKRLGKTTVLNPAPVAPLSDDTLRYVDFLIPNEHELQTMAGVERIDEASLSETTKELLGKGAGAVIVTLGENGCYYADRNGSRTYPAHRVRAVDTTAAGDSFIGGFVAGYIASGDAGEAIRLAQRTAAVTVTRAGAQSSLPTMVEVAAFAASS
ncbi:ribokinase [Paenibacillus flagellatus]|uniref:Ribokinase n=1 Tax=Paenibacillus flagellatus TaxID=2211139 RepID=A0A2V5KZS9_9BACL|nr:ribokinase [Paenibacillus flagellatus]PYI55726.1 ribokinase [Paenibacillus flagellatus]